ncbi:uncharacterized protein LOC135475839 [Liolophura sinensis]|uniref:uncharacterized protein LOC135475839 n=1 Tax=Liolophura sinensis TaxID=3198878 RepID=UPI003158606B
MFYYFWTHIVYHLIKWFHPDNRKIIRILVWITTALLLVPQFYAFAKPESTRYCDQPLYEMLVVSIVLTFVMCGFTFLLTLMDPVPREVKIAFHVFGGVCFVTGLVHSAMVFSALECNIFAEVLYDWSLAVAVLIMICTVYFVILIPCWILDMICSDWILNRKEKTGICYEPEKCCPCLWHV